MRYAICAPLMAVGLLSGCGHTKPGTHVETVNKNGEITYVAGAAAPGMAQSTACKGAVKRAVAAIALEFAQANAGLADELANEMGVTDGRVFLSRYAEAAAVDAAVPDVRYDPSDHLCMATVRWTAPIFVKEAVTQYAGEMKERELTGQSKSAPPPSALPPSASTPPAATRAPTAAAEPSDPCSAQAKAVVSVSADAQRARDDFDECKRRTSGDETICHRYKLYDDKAQAKVRSAQANLDTCRATHPL